MKKYIIEWTERFYVAVAAEDAKGAEAKAMEPYYYDHANTRGIENMEIIEVKPEGEVSAIRRSIGHKAKYRPLRAKGRLSI